MIGRLHGVLLEKQAPALLLDVNGVGYEVFAPMSTFYVLPELGETFTLHTHVVTREDAQLLYGFSSLGERALFRVLIKVNGVGPKLALTILSSIEPDQFIQYVHDNTATALVCLPGVGKKTAERLMIELRDRFKALAQTTSSTTNTTATQIQFMANSPVAEAEAALQSLGYKPAEAQKAVAAVKADHTESADIIRAALKSMMK